MCCITQAGDWPAKVRRSSKGSQTSTKDQGFARDVLVQQSGWERCWPARNVVILCSRRNTEYSVCIQEKKKRKDGQVKSACLKDGGAGTSSALLRNTKHQVISRSSLFSLPFSLSLSVSLARVSPRPRAEKRATRKSPGPRPQLGLSLSHLVSSSSSSQLQQGSRKGLKCLNQGPRAGVDEAALIQTRLGGVLGAWAIS